MDEMIMVYGKPRKKVSLEEVMAFANHYNATPTEIRRIQAFIGKTLVNDRGDQYYIDQWLIPMNGVSYGDFNVIKNPQLGGWICHFSTKQIEKFVNIGHFKIVD